MKSSRDNCIRRIVRRIAVILLWLRSCSWFAVGKFDIYQASGDWNETDHERVLHTLGIVVYHLIIGYVDSISVASSCPKTAPWLKTVSDFQTLRSFKSRLAQKNRQGAMQGGIVEWLGYWCYWKGSWKICRFNSQMARLRSEGGNAWVLMIDSKFFQNVSLILLCWGKDIDYAQPILTQIGNLYYHPQLAVLSLRRGPIDLVD